MKWLFLSIFPLVGIGMVFQVMWSIHFDRIIRHLHATNHALWVRLGEPCGHFWVPAESRKNLIDAGMARASLRTEELVALDLGGHLAQEKERLKFYGLLARLSYVIGLLLLAAFVLG